MSENKDVFISYSSIDVEDARIVKGVLEKNGISCWMAPESIPIGSNYTQAIPAAISGCSAFLVLLSRNAQKSNWVSLELDRAFNEGKLIIPFFIEKCSLTDDFNFMLAKTERIEAYHRKAEALEELVNTIKQIKPTPTPAKKTPYIIIGAVILALIVVAIGAIMAFRLFDSKPDEPVVSAETAEAEQTQPAETEGKAEELTGEGTAADYVKVARTEVFDDINMPSSATFRIPEITIDSDDAQQVNDEIAEQYGKYMDAARDNDKSYYCNYLDYDSYLNGDILSVVITAKFAYTNVYEYSVYNFDVATGNTLNNRALCKKLNTTWDDMKETLQTALKKNYINNFPNFEDTEYMYSTLSSANLEASDLYLGSFKTLMAACTEYTGAGAGVYRRLVEVSNYSY